MTSIKRASSTELLIEVQSWLFSTKDMNGVDFWIEFDGAEGIGFWVGDPENAQPLSMDATADLINWVISNWKESVA